MAKEKTNQEEQVKEHKDVLETNLRFYNQGRTVPSDASKKFRPVASKG